MNLKNALSLRTVRKKILMLSKLAGLALLLSYGLFSALPLEENLSFCLWFIFVLLLVLLIDFLMGHFITKPVSRLNESAKRMAALDFSAPCAIAARDEFGELSQSLNTLSENLKTALLDLTDANARLEEEVAKERKLMAERKDLIDQLSHEMKTPLGIIQAYAEGLQDADSEEKKQKYTEVILSETERMNQLIHALLDLSALENGASQLTITRFDLVELVELTAGRLLFDAPDTNFSLEYELPEQKVYVRSDKARMEQVLENLMLNARKNVRPDGIIKLSLIEKDGFLHFSLFNNGRPIPQESLPHIWTKFYRTNDAAYSGSGLGLSIVAQILSMQQLPYGAKNRPDGVIFYFSIPVSSPRTEYSADGQ